MLGQVLQVPSGSHQQLQGVTTAQLIQPGDLTEEQQQQVRWKQAVTLLRIKEAHVVIIASRAL